MRRGLFFPFTFQNDENLFWVYQNGNFLPGKSISHREKMWKNDFAPSEKFSCTPLIVPDDIIYLAISTTSVSSVSYYVLMNILDLMRNIVTLWVKTTFKISCILSLKPATQGLDYIRPIQESAERLLHLALLTTLYMYNCIKGSHLGALCP